ncbi:hypothetical protein Hte_002058 [Hypoxylon texense]
MGTARVPPPENGGLSTADDVEEEIGVEQDPTQLPGAGYEDPESGERQPLIRSSPPEEEGWVAPRHFVWIEMAIMSNVFLYGFDGTITAATYAVISSEFDATNTASWLTTSYLITRCLGCGIANDIIFLNSMRALAGFGGGGLMTMATIVNSDMIPFRRRGMYQAMQNGIFGFGAYLFLLPLFFQIVLLDSATTAGARLAIPSLATPIGGLVAGIVMSRWGKLTTLIRLGAILMVIGNGLVTSLNFVDSNWKYYVYIFPANLGQGIIYPGILFTSLATFEHAGEFSLDYFATRTYQA